MQSVIIIGAGIAGLSAAIHLAEKNIKSILVSVQPSERAQSVMAEGGINGALNTMGENDCTENHFSDTMRAGCFIADEKAVEGLTGNAPDMIMFLSRLGVPFNMENGRIIQRNFGGQKKKRTAFAMSSTGKMIMTALIDECRKLEAKGFVERYDHHELDSLDITDGVCGGAVITDTFSGKSLSLKGPVILASGGLNGMFPEKTTGTTANSAEAAAAAFAQGVKFSSLEMIQYHPTTIGIVQKRCLISEAARGEGGRLFVMRNGSPWYFMEEKYPEYGNLMPRDVVSRESWFVTHSGECDSQVYLDMTHLPKKTWTAKLPDLREEIIHYLGIDPQKKPVPVEPGIHYFMGGIDVDIYHRTNIKWLYAAGECCSQYHGANRLGGNSLLGALYGGRTAGLRLAEKLGDYTQKTFEAEAVITEKASPASVNKLRDILYSSLGIVRDREQMEAALEKVRAIKETTENQSEKNRASLGEAMLLSALLRKESRGAHYRSDYPNTSDEYKGRTLASTEGGVQVEFIRKN